MTEESIIVVILVFGVPATNGCILVIAQEANRGTSRLYRDIKRETVLSKVFTADAQSGFVVEIMIGVMS